MKQSKKEIMLSEKDALQDLLDAEKLLMSYYNIALTEGSSKSFRGTILKAYTSHADTQFKVFEQMLARGYYQPKPAQKSLVEEQTARFSKSKKQVMEA